MRRFLFDTTVFVYALGRDHPYREPCREIVELQRMHRLEGAISLELIQELLHVLDRAGGDRRRALEAAQRVAALCDLVEAGRDALPLLLSHYSQHGRLDARDALFAATALSNGIDAILSADRDFDGIDGLERVDPTDASAVAALTSH